MKIMAITRDHVSNCMGGTRIYAHDVNRLLAERGHEVIHLCYGSPMEGDVKLDSLHLIKHKKQIKRGLFSFLVRLISIRRWIKDWHDQFQPDVILIHSTEMAQYLIKNGISRQKLVYFVHSVHSHEIVFDLKKTLRSKATLKTKMATLVRALIYVPITYALEALSFRMIERQITMSKYDYSEIMTYHGGYFTQQPVIIPIGIDLIKYQPPADKTSIRASLGFSHDCVVFVVFRRLAPRMGLENLVEAFAKIERKNHCLLLLGGKGELHDPLQQQINRLNLGGKCRLLGYVDDESKLRYLQAADFFVLPTEELEGFGIVILEALACNLPVLGTPAGAIPEILSKLGPEYISQGTDPYALSELLLWAIKNHYRLRNSLCYRELVEREYDWRVIAARIERILSDPQLTRLSQIGVIGK